MPTADWPRIVGGQATEFRISAGAITRHMPPLPTPVVLYRRQRAGSSSDEKLVLLERCRLEALGTIDEESLARAGFPGPRHEAYPRFRRHWMLAERKRFDPLREVVVYTVREFTDADATACGVALVDHLYGAWR